MQLPSRVQQQGLTWGLWRSGRLSLSRQQRAIAQWALVDDQQALLELNCENGQLLQYYAEQYRVRACGTCRSGTLLSEIRNVNGNLELMFGQGNDIPWMNDTFHQVFLTQPLTISASQTDAYAEILRVLSPGGSFIGCLASPLLNPGFREGRRATMLSLAEAGFVDISCRYAFPDRAVVIARKAM